MQFLKTIILVVCLAAVAGTALAQEAEEAPSVFTYATYFYCDVTGEDRVDEIMKTQNAPVYDQLVKEGVISGWGWLTHHTGGKWRRIQYYQASSVAALLDAQTEMGKRLDGVDEAADKDFGKICNAHDDYIWEVESGSSGDTRGDAGFSVYYKCEESKEERADEIFAKDFGPIFDKYVADGKLTSWGWSSHWVGGAYRRLQTMTAANHKDLLKARAELPDWNSTQSVDHIPTICGISSSKRPSFRLVSTPIGKGQVSFREPGPALFQEDHSSVG
jgi:hypothetical protein